MEISEVKAALGKRVTFRDAEYVLTGCIIRRSERGYFFYQAEIADLKQNSVCIVRLDEIEEVKT